MKGIKGFFSGLFGGNKLKHTHDWTEWKVAKAAFHNEGKIIEIITQSRVCTICAERETKRNGQ